MPPSGAYYKKVLALLSFHQTLSMFLVVTSSLVTSPMVVPSTGSSAVQMDDILTASYGCSMVAPSDVLMGDITLLMSRWELE